MTTTYIAIGTNLGDRLANIQTALSEMGKRCSIIDCSPIYETKPWGFSNQPDFLNCVVKAEAGLNPMELLEFLLDIEKKMGRVRKDAQKNSPRIIDLDILLYGHELIETQRLTIPHPRMKERAFVIIPLYGLCKEKWIKQAIDKLPKDNGVKYFGTLNP